jgi:hypothetical protein
MMRDDYYYTPEEWSRSIGYGTVPDERNKLMLFKVRAQAAQDALLGKRDDVYPCRDDVPPELWGMPIVSNK